MTPLDIAPMSDTARALLRIVAPGPVTLRASALASMLGVSERHTVRAAAELEALGYVDRVGRGGRGRPATLTPKPDLETKLRTACQGLGRDDGPPGHEYTPLRDEATARADRARLMASNGWRPRVTRPEGVALSDRSEVRP